MRRPYLSTLTLLGALLACGPMPEISPPDLDPPPPEPLTDGEAAALGGLLVVARAAAAQPAGAVGALVSAVVRSRASCDEAIRGITRADLWEIRRGLAPRPDLPHTEITMTHLIDLSELPDVRADRCPHRHRPQWCPTCVAEHYGPHPSTAPARRPGDRRPAGPTERQRAYADALARELGHDDAGDAAIVLGGWIPRTRADWSELIGDLLAEARKLRAVAASTSDRLAAESRGLPPGVHD